MHGTETIFGKFHLYQNKEREKKEIIANLEHNLIRRWQTRRRVVAGADYLQDQH
jgi:hypothetical protein